MALQPSQQLAEFGRHRGVGDAGAHQRARRRNGISGRDIDTDGMNRDQLRLGMSGSATAFAGNAGVIGLLASILVWVSSYTAYL